MEEAHRDRDRARLHVVQRRGISSGLPAETSRRLHLSLDALTVASIVPLARRPGTPHNFGMRPLRPVLPGSLAAGLLLCFVGCASLMKTRPVTTTPDPRPEPTFVTDGPGCDDSRKKARR